MKRKGKAEKCKNWGLRLEAVLKEKNITKKKSASIAGIAPSVISSWIGGASPTDYLALKKLCNHLKVSFTWILTGEKEGENEPSLSEMYQEVEFFNGLARIRIDRLVPRKNKNEGIS